MATALPNAEYLPEVPVRERIARGKELARQVPHELHASWEEEGSREETVAILERQAAVRVPELVPIRHAPDGELGLRSLQGSRRRHGRRPRHDVHSGPGGSALRRRTSTELRDLRDS